jgi:uncharacterized membrane protein YbhN (UPF0104 family)
MNEKKKPAKRNWKMIVRAVVGAILMVLLVRYVIDNKQQFGEIFSNLSAPIFVLMLLALLANDIVYGCGFYAIIHAQGAKLRLIDGLRILSISRFLGTFIPHSGFVYRGIALKEEADFEVKKYMHAAIAFSWFSLIASSAIALVILIVGQRKVMLSGVDSRVALGLLIFAGVAVPLVSHIVLHSWQQHDESFVGKLIGKLQRASQAIVDLLFHPVLVLQFLVLAASGLVLTCMAFYMAFKSGGHAVDICGLVLLFVAHRVGLISNFTPGNIGLLEFALGYIAAAQGFHHSVGVFAMLTVRAVGFLSICASTMIFGGSGTIQSMRRFMKMRSA